MANSPLTDSEWAEIREQLAEIARKHNLETFVYPPKKQPSPASPYLSEEKEKAS